MYLIAFPLLLIPLVLYHMVAFLLALPLDTTLFAVPVLAGERVAVNFGEALVMLGMLLLYVRISEIHPACRQRGHGPSPVADAVRRHAVRVRVGTTGRQRFSCSSC